MSPSTIGLVCLSVIVVALAGLGLVALRGKSTSLEPSPPLTHEELLLPLASLGFSQSASTHAYGGETVFSHITLPIELRFIPGSHPVIIVPVGHDELAHELRQILIGVEVRKG